MAPQIILRAGWGARPPKSAWSPWPAGQPSGHTIHWEGAGGHADHSMCAAEVRSIQAYHQSGEYIDIAYNWIVCIHGVVYQGRPATYQSAAQRLGNPLRVAICYMAGPSWPFTGAAQSAIAWLITQNAPARAIPHQDEPSCQTSCAGSTINHWVRVGEWALVLPPRPIPTPPPAPNPIPPGGFHHPTLRQGSVGPAVLQLQAELYWGFGQHLALDGRFGPATASAVRNVQAFGHLVQDGIAGPKTWGLIDFIVASKHH